MAINKRFLGKPTLKPYQQVKAEMEARDETNPLSGLRGVTCPGCSERNSKPTPGRYRVLDTRQRKRADDIRREVLCVVCKTPQFVIEKDGKFSPEPKEPPPPPGSEELPPAQGVETPIPEPELETVPPSDEPRRPSKRRKGK
jgi:hypothetical protein